MEGIIALIVAVIAVGVVWKLLKGIVKTVALGAILVFAAVFVFGVM